jgi:hypothetical protein
LENDNNAGVAKPRHIFFAQNSFFRKEEMYISRLRRSGSIIHSPTRRFTSGYQDGIRSGFYIGLTPLQVSFSPLLSAFSRLVNSCFAGRNPERRRFSQLSAGTLSPTPLQPPELES